MSTSHTTPMQKTSGSLPRASGILLHPTSLSGPGIGDLGDAAFRFVDWLADAGQSYWQILPLVPVDEGGSPYNGLSALAGNPLLVSPERLMADRLLDARQAADPGLPAEHVDFPAVFRWKERLLDAAFAAFRAGRAPALREPFAAFRGANRDWLPDYSLFRVLRERFHGAPWTRWDAELRARVPGALAAAREELAEDVERFQFRQFLFERQWAELRRYARGRGVQLVGDVPIFVAHDSADVWANPHLFRLDDHGEPTAVSGVPPDYFSQTGQRWGNPLYRWDVLRGDGYRWWVRRFQRTLEWVDLMRIDHFRGFESYWEIPAAEKTAMHGQWRTGPGEEFFRSVERQLGELPVIAEDLGLITRGVEELRDVLDLPGMRVLQFAFDGDPDNPHLPENHPANAVAYTGTHDNDTTLGWWAGTSPEQRQQVLRRIPAADADLHWALIALVLHSAARLAVVPIQDVLGLGSEARMNTPGTSEHNWTWRLPAGLPSPAVRERLHELTLRSGRLQAAAAGPST